MISGILTACITLWAGTVWRRVDFCLLHSRTLMVLFSFHVSFDSVVILAVLFFLHCLHLVAFTDKLTVGYCPLASNFHQDYSTCHVHVSIVLCLARSTESTDTVCCQVVSIQRFLPLFATRKNREPSVVENMARLIRAGPLKWAYGGCPLFFSFRTAST